jgi:hypothetical protein
MVQSLAGAVGLRLGAAFGNLHYPAFQQPYAEISDTFLKPGCDGLQPAVTREESGLPNGACRQHALARRFS